MRIIKTHRSMPIHNMPNSRRWAYVVVEVEGVFYIIGEDGAPESRELMFQDTHYKNTFGDT